MAFSIWAAGGGVCKSSDQQRMEARRLGRCDELSERPCSTVFRTTAWAWPAGRMSDSPSQALIFLGFWVLVEKTPQEDAGEGWLRHKAMQLFVGRESLRSGRNLTDLMPMAALFRHHALATHRSRLPDDRTPFRTHWRSLLAPLPCGSDIGRCYYRHGGEIA